MEDLQLINNTSVYRNPAPQSALQGPGVMQPAIVYSKIMLRTIELEASDYEFDKLAIERLMESNNGANEIMFKRFLALAAHTQPLVEGIPPASDQGRMVAIKGTCKSYGRVMKFTDKVNWAVVDPLISEYTTQLSKKIPETKDILAQEALLAECQTFYAGGKVSINSDPDLRVIDNSYARPNHIMELTTKCNPTIDEFRQIVLSMEACKVRPYSGGNYLCLVSPAVEFDLVTDKRIREFMHDTKTGEPYKTDKVLSLFKLVFRTAKTIKTDNSFVDESGAICYIFEGIDGDYYVNFKSSKSALAVNDTGAGKLIHKTTGVVTDVASMKIVADSATPGTNEYKIGIFDKLNVHHSFVLGDSSELLFRIGVSGHTAPQFIKKELGSAGTEDPLNQRQSIGWKIDTLGYKVVNPDAVVDYMSIPSQYRINVNARPDLKNQFTDYNYGYRALNASREAVGDYYHPEQVVSVYDKSAAGTAADPKWKFFVRGTDIEVGAVKLASLIKPIGVSEAHRIGSDGKHVVIKGNVPTMQFALIKNSIIVAKFLKDQVTKHTDGEYYIKGCEGVADAKVVALPQVDIESVVKGDGTGYEDRSVEHEPEPNPNKTGDKRIDE